MDWKRKTVFLHEEYDAVVAYLNFAESNHTSKGVLQVYESI